jgi:glycosyltransferase involved in cell wall biosynthesis
MSSVITVLMPVYNAEKYLREAIDSILMQTLKEFEFLIIDDGSTDSSVEIIKSYSDTRIRLVQNDQNFGITYTLNRGIYLASNELIARMDADDISYPERLERQYMYAQRYADLALISAWIRQIRDDGTFEKFSGNDTRDVYYRLLFGTGGIYHPVVMFRKSAVMDVGLYSKPYAEDFNLWCKLVKKYKFHVIPEYLLDYRSSDTSLWRVTRKREYADAHCDQIRENVSFYTNNRCNLTDDEANFLTRRMAPLLALKDAQSVEVVFEKLDFINKCFLSFKNCNNPDDEGTADAAFLYKLLLVKKLSKKWSKKKLLLLLIKLRYWQILFFHFPEIFQQKEIRDSHPYSNPSSRRLIAAAPLTTHS